MPFLRFFLCHAPATSASFAESAVENSNLQAYCGHLFLVVGLRMDFDAWSHELEGWKRIMSCYFTIHVCRKLVCSSLRLLVVIDSGWVMPTACWVPERRRDLTAFIPGTPYSGIFLLLFMDAADTAVAGREFWVPRPLGWFAERLGVRRPDRRRGWPAWVVNSFGQGLS
jgi:hypothetical protein